MPCENHIRRRLSVARVAINVRRNGFRALHGNERTTVFGCAYKFVACRQIQYQSRSVYRVGVRRGIDRPQIFADFRGDFFVFEVFVFKNQIFAERYFFAR